MPLSNPIFRRIGRLADEQGVRAFVVGGYVRDYYLRRPSTDIDVVVVGSGIALAEALGLALTVFPGDHGGFLGGEYGQSGVPEAFAAQLREVLDAA